MIFGAALWRARDGLKSKVADSLILNSLPGWPQSNAEAGYPFVGPANTTAAYTAYYYQCFSAMMDTLLADPKKGPRNAARLLGAFLAHGITGTDTTNSYTMDATASSKGLQLDFSYTKAKKAKSDGSSVNQKKILVNVTDTYLVTISNPSSGGGRYKAKLKAK